MSKTTHIFLVIVLAYVCVLNAVIVNVLYSRFIQNKKHIAPPQMRLMRNATRPALREHVPPTSCGGSERRALLVVAAKHTDSNDFMRQAPTLAQLRQVLRSHTVDANVFLVATADSFVGFHRSWCNALYIQTQQRVACKLLLVQSTENSADVFRELLSEAPCTSEIVLLPDSVEVKSNFFTQLEKTNSKRVTCLVSEATHNFRCPGPAFRLPRLFVDVYTGEAPIETAARGMHMYGGHAAVVKLA